MGSENARVIAEYGGSWLNGNEYMLLNTMAWNCYDPPQGPNGEKPLQIFMSAQTLANKAFGQYMPEKPPDERKPFVGRDKVDSNAYINRNKQVTKARAELVRLGVLRIIKKAGNGTTGHYELDLDRVKYLGIQHFERSSDEHQAKVNAELNEKVDSESAENGDSSYRKYQKGLLGNTETVDSTAPNQPKRFSESTKNGDLNNNSKNNSKNSGYESTSSQATHLRVVNGSEELDDDLPLTQEQERNRQAAALRELMKNEPPASEPEW